QRTITRVSPPPRLPWNNGLIHEKSNNLTSFHNPRENKDLKRNCAHLYERYILSLETNKAIIRKKVEASNKKDLAVIDEFIDEFMALVF
ncbi:MAG: hypothetical protein V1850_04195, partial [Candidatus Bathyarchaeota archaeon]